MFPFRRKQLELRSPPGERIGDNVFARLYSGHCVADAMVGTARGKHSGLGRHLTADQRTGDSEKHNLVYPHGGQAESPVYDPSADNGRDAEKDQDSQSPADIHVRIPE
jgi:hypothetical protein